MTESKQQRYPKVKLNSGSLLATHSRAHAQALHGFDSHVESISLGTVKYLTRYQSQDLTLRAEVAASIPPPYANNAHIVFITTIAAIKAEVNVIVVLTQGD